MTLVPDHAGGVTVSREGPVYVVTLDRAEKRNAIDGAMHTRLSDLWLELDDDADVRCVLIQAEGETFTAGGDFSWFKVQQENPAEREKAFREGHRILDRMMNCRVPVVTAIQGGAVGLGASLGILSDIVVMSEDAFYRDTHVSLGMSAGDGGIAWPMSVGMQIAKEYVLLGDRLPAAEAYRLGMVNRVVARDDLRQTAREYAVRLSELPAIAAQSTKRAFNLQYEQQLRAVAEYTLAWERLCTVDSEFTAKMKGL